MQTRTHFIALLFLIASCNSKVSTDQARVSTNSSQCGGVGEQTECEKPSATDPKKGETGANKDANVSFAISNASSKAGGLSVKWEAVQKAAEYEIVVASDIKCEAPLVRFSRLKDTEIEISVTGGSDSFICIYAIVNNARVAASNNGFRVFVEPASSATSTTKLATSTTIAPSSTTTTTTLPPNTPPTIAFVQPLGSDDSVLKGQNFTVQWTDSDPDNDASISLYYVNRSATSCSGGTLIQSGISENSSTNQFSWNTTGVAAGIYKICASINDQVNSAVEALSDPIVVYEYCTWTGLANTVWTNSANWVGCASSTPAANEAILVPNWAVNSPIVSANASVGSAVAASDGGGLVTVAAGVTLTFTANNAVIQSSIGFQGDSATCTTCKVRFNGTSTKAQNNATVTLKKGITLSILNGGHNTAFSFGGASSGASLKVEAGATEAEWATIKYGGGLTFSGVSGAPSVATINGLRLELGGSVWSGGDLAFSNYFEIAQLDNIRFYRSTSVTDSNAINISSCASGQITDSSWTNIIFPVFYTASEYRGHTPTTVYLPADCAGQGPISISGSGFSYGNVFEGDPSNSLNWTNGASSTCTWTGAQNSTWNNKNNWSGCANGRAEYPDVNDFVIIPSGVSPAPVVNSDAAARSIASGSNSSVTVNAGNTLYLADSASSVVGTITFQGDTPTCLTCRVTPSRSMNINNGGVLRLGLGIAISPQNEGSINVGDALSAGHLVSLASGQTSDKWPRLEPLEYQLNGLRVQGAAGQLSSVSVDGIKLNSFAKSWGANGVIEFRDYFSIVKFDNVIFSGYTGISGLDSNMAHIDLQTCANSNVLDLTWSGIDFMYPIDTSVSTYNIRAANCSALAATPIVVTNLSGGSNLGFGASNESDPDGVITWQ